MTPVQSATTSRMFNPAAEPSCLSHLIQKVSDWVFSKWTLVVAAACFAGACFGAAVASVTFGIGILIISSSQANEDVFSAYPVGTAGYYVDVMNQTLAEISRGVHLDLQVHREMLEQARIVQELPPGLPPANPVETQIIVEPCTSLEMARRIVQNGQRPFILNMANEIVPGGGARRGARAQEEALCRCSDLLPALEELTYPLPERGGAYVPGVQFFRDDDFHFISPIVVDVYACAAYNLNPSHRVFGPDHDAWMREAYVPGTAAKIRTALRTAIRTNHRYLVWSAFGCGAFRNDPEFMSRLHRQILNEDEFRGAFDMVAFAIYDAPGGQLRPNFPVFRDVLT